MPKNDELRKTIAVVKWRPHRDSNPDRSLRRRLLYPVEL